MGKDSVTQHAGGIEIRPLSVFTGAEIHGVDLRQPLAPHQVAAIRQALARWKVVFFRDQHIDHAQHLAFAELFGRPTSAHPYDANPPDGFPQIRTISSHSTSGRRGERWHTDVTGVVNPPAASILRAGEQVPEYGGDTLFTNLVAAYRHLSPPLQALADGLRARHQFGGYNGDFDNETVYAQRVRAEPRVAEHPVVRVLPDTGERALFVNPGFTRRIVGLSEAESRHLLALFFEAITQPEYTARFRWAPGSIAFWDNRATAHQGPGDFAYLDAERVLYRITLAGEVPVGVDGRESQAIAGGRFDALTPVRPEAEPALV
ncbi:taurine dioxygenase [Bordetella genomosp. 1]|uniref:Taurine dioxygenase n=1 Tax=Bordetella genomosp. 1 TaxID=1395607 RepID=A0A261SE82_9BORD|nr:TauD/TfdA family dioxygenase [Bordetella genomosp. 1]MDQ8034629.1 TauD/TfdA family dioxygenase [Bordetella sp.]OZI35297.1 taurine dioxygenase [Bordetella genomosp. 1]OZI63837.1 taurine dioxygenase [Bordetella genomosp. 1]